MCRACRALSLWKDMSTQSIASSIDRCSQYQTMSPNAFCFWLLERGRGFVPSPAHTCCFGRSMRPGQRGQIGSTVLVCAPSLVLWGSEVVLQTWSWQFHKYMPVFAPVEFRDLQEEDICMRQKGNIPKNYEMKTEESKLTFMPCDPQCLPNRKCTKSSSWIVSSWFWDSRLYTMRYEHSQTTNHLIDQCRIPSMWEAKIMSQCTVDKREDEHTDHCHDNARMMTRKITLQQPVLSDTEKLPRERENILDFNPHWDHDRMRHL